MKKNFFGIAGLLVMGAVMTPVVKQPRELP
jgi:hypothetical protein